MTDLKYAVVGVGALGRHHARIAAGLPGVSLVAVADPNESQGRAIAESWNAEWVADYRDLLDRVDAASVAVPTFLHRRVAGDFLLRGIPVLIEKPLAGTVSDGDALVLMARQRRTLLQVGHIERFNPAFQETLARTAQPRYIRAERLSPYAFRSMDIGAVHDLMIHDIDLVLRLADSGVVGVEAFGASLLGGREDAVQARLRFESGCIADLVANRVSPEFCRSLQVWSPQGCVTANLHTREVTHHRPSARLLNGELPYDLAQRPDANIDTLKQAVFGDFIAIERPALEEVDQLTAEISSFVNCVLTGASPEVDGVEACEALRVAESILERVAEHQWDGSPEGLCGADLPHTRVKRRAA